MPRSRRSAPEPRGTTLSEHASKQLLAKYGVPVARERLADNPEEAARAAQELGFPVVVKLCGPAIAHKSERNLVRLDLGDEASVRAAAKWPNCSTPAATLSSSRSTSVAVKSSNRFPTGRRKRPKA